MSPVFLLAACCSDEGCDEELSIEAESVESLDESLCECDCALVLLSVEGLEAAA